MVSEDPSLRDKLVEELLSNKVVYVGPIRQQLRAEFKDSAVARINGIDPYSPSLLHPMVHLSWYGNVRYCR